MTHAVRHAKSRASCASDRGRVGRRAGGSGGVVEEERQRTYRASAPAAPTKRARRPRAATSSGVARRPGRALESRVVVIGNQREMPTGVSADRKLDARCPRGREQSTAIRCSTRPRRDGAGARSSWSERRSRRSCPPDPARPAAVTRRRLGTLRQRPSTAARRGFAVAEANAGRQHDQTCRGSGRT